MYQTPYAVANPFNNFQQPQMQPQYNIPQQQIVKVHGKSGADTYQMAPNSSALLLDESAPIIWLAQTDGAGYKTLTAYDIQIHKDVPPIDVNSLEQRISRLEEMMTRESNTTNAKQWQPNLDKVKPSTTNDSDGKVRK